MDGDDATAFHFHCNAELGAMLPLHAGDDAVAVRWLDVSTRASPNTTTSTPRTSCGSTRSPPASATTHKDDHQFLVKVMPSCARRRAMGGERPGGDMERAAYV